MKTTLLLISVVAAMLPTAAQAQQPDHKYEVGIRSALIVGSMNLSGLDPAFDDLAADGPEGPHMSGFFFLHRVRPHLRVGVETLVANSTQEERTTMNYQAAGPVVALSYGSTWFIAGGVHAGGLIVNAMARSGAAQPDGVESGSYFKSDGGFVAPFADVGYRFRRGEIGVFVKRVSVFGETDRSELSKFGSTFTGLRFALGL